MDAENEASLEVEECDHHHSDSDKPTKERRLSGFDIKYMSEEMKEKRKLMDKKKLVMKD